MAIIVYPNAGLIPMANRVLNPSVHFHLFANNLTITRATVLGDFTEMIATGYAPINVNLADWVLQGIVADHGVSQAAPIAFLTSDVGANPAYGYFVTDASNAVLFWALKFDAAIGFDAATPVVITPFFGDFSTNP
jgi:hypothetical protein